MKTVGGNGGYFTSPKQKKRRSGSETFSYLREKNEQELAVRKEELEIREREIEDRQIQRSMGK